LLPLNLLPPTSPTSLVLFLFFAALLVLTVPSSSRLANRLAITAPCLTPPRSVRSLTKPASPCSKPRTASSSNVCSAPRVSRGTRPITCLVLLPPTLSPRMPPPPLRLPPPAQPRLHHQDAVASNLVRRFPTAEIIPTCPSSPRNVFLLPSNPVVLAVG